MTEQELLEDLIQDEIEKLKGLGPKYAAMDEYTLRRMARRNIANARTTLIRKLLKEDDESQSNVVGDLFGKSREQILRDQQEPLRNPNDYGLTIGDLYGKTRTQILKEQEEP